MRRTGYSTTRPSSKADVPSQGAPSDFFPFYFAVAVIVFATPGFFVRDLSFNAVVALVGVAVLAGFSFLDRVILRNMPFQNWDRLLRICASAFVGCFLLCVFIFIVVVSNGQGEFVQYTIGLFALFSLFFLLLSFAMPPAKVMPEPGVKGETQGPDVLLPSASESYYPPSHDDGDDGIKTTKLPPPVDRATLPPLFGDDPLYQMPQPRTSAIRVLYVVKEREDACVISQNETRFALSDGASASSLPRPWATLLGQQWIKYPFGETGINKLADWLEEPRQLWEQWVKETWITKVNERNRLTGDYPVERDGLLQILERGAFATLLGVQLSRQAQQWRALAIGDSCLFMVRRSSPPQILMSLPMEKSTDFSNRPPLLSSRRDADVNALLPAVRFGSGIYEKGDIMLLATDALSQWLLLQAEQGEATWLEELLSMRNQEMFARFVNKQRQDGMMEEDDTTLVMIAL